MKFDADARNEAFHGSGVESDWPAPWPSTMGPSGRNVVVQKAFGGPAVTKDGVSVSRQVEIQLSQPFENMGAQMVHQVAKKNRRQGR